MYLNKLIIINYRSCNLLEINFCADEPNIFIGINDCGKSTILKAIELLLSPKPNFNFIKDDIRKKHFPPFKFDGVIGGSPCQDFSKARRTPPTGNGLEMLKEFKRIVLETNCKWFLLENVPECPDLDIAGYDIQRFTLNAKHCGSKQNRNRKFQFGSVNGLFLNIKREPSPSVVARCVTASEGNKLDRRSFADFCELQGLPRTFDLPDFTQSGKYRAVGNGVHIAVSRKVATAIREATEGNESRLITQKRFCACGCGEVVEGKQTSKTPACRKRLQMRRRQLMTIFNYDLNMV